MYLNKSTVVGQAQSIFSFNIVLEPLARRTQLREPLLDAQGTDT